VKAPAGASAARPTLPGGLGTPGAVDLDVREALAGDVITSMREVPEFTQHSARARVFQGEGLPDPEIARDLRELLMRHRSQPCAILQAPHVADVSMVPEDEWSMVQLMMASQVMHLIEEVALPVVAAHASAINMCVSYLTGAGRRLTVVERSGFVRLKRRNRASDTEWVLG